MAHVLSTEEQEYFKDLSERFDDHVAEYRKRKQEQLNNGQRKIIEEERDRLRGYCDLVTAGNVSDVLINIEFKHAKLKVLNELLGEAKRPSTTIEHTPTRSELRILAKACEQMYNHETNSIRDTFGFAQRLLSTLQNDKGEIIASITIYIAHLENGNVSAYFNDHNARLASSTVSKCILRKDVSGRAQIACKPPLDAKQQHEALMSLATHLQNYSLPQE